MPVLECGEVRGVLLGVCVFTGILFVGAFGRACRISRRRFCNEYQTIQDNDHIVGGDRCRSRNANAQDAGKRQRFG